MILRIELTFCLIVVIMIGCAPRGPTTYEVSGKVTWNGEPLVKGNIVFEDQATAPGAGVIVNGEFRFKSTEGKKLVRILAMRETGRQDPAMGGGPIYQQFIPDYYNAASELSADVTPNGNNVFEFHLKERR